MISFLVLELSRDTQWMPLLLPLFEAGLRFRLRGLASTWVVVTLVNLVAQFEDTYQFDPQSFAARSSLLLVVAAPAAFISQLLMEELVIQAGTRRGGPTERGDRSRRRGGGAHADLRP
ncbi:MAG: hypothetical protein R2715_15380 [Ilumatobacteraceae bacterium]